MVAEEIEGVPMGNEGTRIAGDTSPTVGEFFGSLIPGPNARSQTRSVSVEVGEVESAVDLTIALKYGRSIPQLSEAVRRNVVGRVENLVGLRAAEVTITANDVFFPEQ